jgi:hypothetical protein
MTSADLLVDGFKRIRETVDDVLSGLTPDQLTYRADAAANPVSWLIWHLTRVQDDHVSKAFEAPQVWSAGEWARRFGLPVATMEIGYGHSRDQVATVAAATASATLLKEYHEATFTQTVQLVSGVKDHDLDAIVDTRWMPPVTLGVRLISVLNDDMQHAGQAAFVRGLIKRATR